MAKILIFDCDQRRLWEYARVLPEHHVIGATSMADAINRCRRTSIDLIVADWFFADGPELIYQMASLCEPIMTPVYLVDRSERPHDPTLSVRRAVELGAAGFISCLSLDQFARAVNAVVAKAQIRVRSSVPARHTPRSDQLARALTNTPVVRIARQIGGLRKLTGIMNRHRIRTSHGWYERFTKALNDWAVMDPVTRYVAVCYAAEDLRHKPNNPVNAALIEVADAIVASMTAG